MMSPGVGTIAHLSPLLCLICGWAGADEEQTTILNEETKKLNADLEKVQGMECKNGIWYFRGAQVANVEAFGGKKVESEGKKGIPCVDDNGQDFQLQKTDDNEDDITDEETGVGWDSSNQVKKITPIKSLTELKGVQEIKKMTPVNWIEEIKSMKEVKSIEEIKEKIAREFIRKHGLKNLIGGDSNHAEFEEGPRPYGERSVEDTDGNIDGIEQELETLEKNIIKDEEICDEMTNDVEELIKKISALEKVKEKHCNSKEREISEYEGLKDQLTKALDYTMVAPQRRRKGRRRESRIDPELIKSIEPVKAEEVVSKTNLKTVEEIVSMDPVKNIQEVKNLYELTADEARQLKAMVLAAGNGKRKRRI